MKTSEQIRIEPHNDLCLWHIDTDKIAYDTTVIVGLGCQALYIENGGVNLFDVGRYCINAKKSRRDNKVIELVGVNRRKTFTLAWGVGGVPYKDKKTSLQTEIGMHGEYTIQVVKAVQLYSEFGKHDVSPDNILHRMRAKLTEKLKSQLSLMLNNHSYHDIQSKQSEISDIIHNEFKKELFNIGVELTQFALTEIYFPDDFKERLMTSGDRLEEMLNQKDAERRERVAKMQELEAMKNFIVAVNSTAKQSINVSTRCSVCGLECQSNALFCPKCGNELKR